jgi:hypothetical protein
MVLNTILFVDIVRKDKSIISEELCYHSVVLRQRAFVSIQSSIQRCRRSSSECLADLKRSMMRERIVFRDFFQFRWLFVDILQVEKMPNKQSRSRCQEDFNRQNDFVIYCHESEAPSFRVA